MQEAQGHRWETLKRRVQLLARVDGHAILFDDGVHVATPQRVLDADRLVKRLREHGVLDRDTVEKATSNERPPLRVTRELLATAQDDGSTVDGLFEA
jgi:hypothetical protein